MPVPTVNNVATQDNYVDALTVQFQVPRNTFLLAISNKAIYYKVILTSSLYPGGGQVEATEHYLFPSITTFEESDLPQGSKYAGIQMRSGAAGQPANVTII
jgi:hypothetical protein